MIRAKDLVVGDLYFLLDYFDENLTIPDIKTVFLIEEHSPAPLSGSGDEARSWVFQPAEYFLDENYRSSLKGALSITNLQAVHDWDSLVVELAENLSCQNSGRPFD